MATASGVPSASDSSLIALLGQELYEDYFGTGEDGSVVPDSAVGGVADADENQACVLESLVDSQASHAFENTEIPSNSVPTEAKSRFADPKSEEDVANARRVSVPMTEENSSRYKVLCAFVE